MVFTRCTSSNGATALSATFFEQCLKSVWNVVSQTEYDFVFLNTSPLSSWSWLRLSRNFFWIALPDWRSEIKIYSPSLFLKYQMGGSLFYMIWVCPYCDFIFTFSWNAQTETSRWISHKRTLCSYKALLEYWQTIYILCNGFVDCYLILCLCNWKSKGTRLRKIFMTFLKGSKNWKQSSSHGSISWCCSEVVNRQITHLYGHTLRNLFFWFPFSRK